MIHCQEIEIKDRVRAIVMFGPPTVSSGFKAGEYFSAILDPNMLSPGGGYLRFESAIQPGSEIHGWQKVSGLTVCEILEHLPPYDELPAGYTVDLKAVLRIRAIEKEEDGELNGP